MRRFILASQDEPVTADDAAIVSGLIERMGTHPLVGRHSKAVEVASVETALELMKGYKELMKEGMSRVKESLSPSNTEWSRTSTSRAMLGLVTKRLGTGAGTHFRNARVNPRMEPLVERVVGDVESLTNYKIEPIMKADSFRSARTLGYPKEMYPWGATGNCHGYYRQLLMSSFLKSRSMKTIGSEMFQITRDLPLDEMSEGLLEATYKSSSPMVLDPFLTRRDNTRGINADLIEKIKKLETWDDETATGDKVLDDYIDQYSTDVRDRTYGSYSARNIPPSSLDTAIHFMRLISENNNEDDVSFDAISLIDDDYEKVFNEEREIIDKTVSYYMLRKSGVGRTLKSFEPMKRLLDLGNKTISESVWNLTLADLNKRTVHLSCDVTCDFIEYQAKKISSGSGGNQEWRNKAATNLKDWIKKGDCKKENKYVFQRGAGCQTVYPRTVPDDQE